MELAGRIALVTGAGQRLGRALATALGARGARVGVHYHASADGAAATAREIAHHGGEARLFRADLREPDAPERLVAAVTDAFGALDVLVNSAAVMRRTPFGEVTPSAWDDMHALNLRAPFFLTQAAAVPLTRAGGVVVNIADLAALETWPAYVPHGISKAGVVQMTRALARVLAPAVRVNAIAPGVVLLPDEFSSEDGERLAATTPLARLGAPNDVVEAMLYLIGADYVTGELLVVDGGRHVRR